MAEVYETWNSGPGTLTEKGEGGSYTAEYKVDGAPNRAAAIDLVRAVASVAVEQLDGQTLVRQSFDTKPDEAGSWVITVQYGPEDSPQSQERPEPGFWKFSASTKGGTRNVRFGRMLSRHWNSQALEAPPTPLINHDGKTTRGVDLPAPSLKFSITAYYDPRDVGPAFFVRMASAVGTMNSDAFLGFEPGEIAYWGCDGQGDIPLFSGQRVQPIAITHDFEYSPNEDNVQIDGIDQGKDASGQSVSSIVKRGWDYLWIRDMQVQAEEGAGIQPIAKHVYVDEVCDELAFIEFFGFGAP